MNNQRRRNAQSSSQSTLNRTNVTDHSSIHQTSSIQHTPSFHHTSFHHTSIPNSYTSTHPSTLTHPSIHSQAGVLYSRGGETVMRGGSDGAMAPKRREEEEEEEKAESESHGRSRTKPREGSLAARPATTPPMRARTLTRSLPRSIHSHRSA